MEIIKVYNIGNKTDEIEIDNVKKKNIIKLFSQLKEMDLLKINCILDTDNEEYKESPIYYF